jgi:hypothetical protein
MRRALPLLALLPLLPVAAHAGIVSFDRMTDPFPPNPCLPNTDPPVVFVGAYCDGVACPPDPWNLAGCSGTTTALQIGLPGVLVPVRRAEISGGPTANARSVPSSSRIDVTTRTPAFVAMDLTYSASDLDLVSTQALAFRVELQGDISPAKPLWCLAQIGDNANPALDTYARLEIAATAPGELVLPLASFRQAVPFTYTGVDAVTFTFRDCPVAACTGSYPGRAYSIGPVTIDTGGPTPIAATSWGRLRTLYR